MGILSFKGFFPVNTLFNFIFVNKFCLNSTMKF